MFDALFPSLPLASKLDRVEATPARPHEELPWEEAAKTAYDEVVESHPVLIRISAAKRLRDSAERKAREAGEERVTSLHVDRAREALAGQLA